MPLFSLNNITFGYTPERPIFQGLNLEVQAGEKICLLGANGSGKSTLLKILCGLMIPHSGCFKAFGEEITEKHLDTDAVAKEYHRRIGFIFQNSDAQLFTTRVWDEIAFGPLQLGMGSETVHKRVEDVLGLLNINHLKDRTPYHLSGGEKKKVAVASVLALNPEVLIFDEPTNGLDPKTQRWLTELLLELNSYGRTIIIATHNLELAHVLADRVLVLSEQHQLMFDGPNQDALENHQLLVAANLIDEYHHSHGEGEHAHRHTHG